MTNPTFIIFGSLFVLVLILSLFVHKAIDWINKDTTEKKNKTKKEEV